MWAGLWRTDNVQWRRRSCIVVTAPGSPGVGPLGRSTSGAQRYFTFLLRGGLDVESGAACEDPYLSSRRCRPMISFFILGVVLTLLTPLDISGLGSSAPSPFVPRGLPVPISLLSWLSFPKYLSPQVRYCQPRPGWGRYSSPLLGRRGRYSRSIMVNVLLVIPSLDEVFHFGL